MDRLQENKVTYSFFSIYEFFSFRVNFSLFNRSHNDAAHYAITNRKIINVKDKSNLFHTPVHTHRRSTIIEKNYDFRGFPIREKGDGNSRRPRKIGKNVRCSEDVWMYEACF